MTKLHLYTQRVQSNTLFSGFVFKFLSKIPANIEICFEQFNCFIKITFEMWQEKKKKKTKNAKHRTIR